MVSEAARGAGWVAKTMSLRSSTLLVSSQLAIIKYLMVLPLLSALLERCCQV